LGQLGKVYGYVLERRLVPFNFDQQGLLIVWASNHFLMWHFRGFIATRKSVDLASSWNWNLFRITCTWCIGKSSSTPSIYINQPKS
jgi:hypothetical protein